TEQIILWRRQQYPGVVETEGGEPGCIEPFLVFVSYCFEHRFAIPHALLFENGGKTCARVLRINIDFIVDQCAVTNHRATQIESAIDFKMGGLFNHLGDQFSKNQLLGKVLGSNPYPIVSAFLPVECTIECQT